MRKVAVVLLAMVLGLFVIVLADTDSAVLVQNGTQVVEVDPASASQITGTVAYQGPVFNADNENWKDAHAYSGVLIRDLLGSVGGMREGDLLAVVASDGYYKQVPYGVVYSTTSAGAAILAYSKDGESGFEGAPTFMLLPEDEHFSNDDMLSSFGKDLSHYYSGRPSTTGLMVKDVAYLIVNYDGGALPEKTPVGETTVLAPSGSLTVVVGDTSTNYTISDLEGLDVVTSEGTFVNTVGVDYTATYSGVPMATLIGNVSADTTIRVTASDGYSMNYEAGKLLDRSEGTWILAYKENGSYMPYDPGPFRIVLVGENNPRFEGAVSAKMVSRIDILGTYDDYSLLVQGAVTRTFSRSELEGGVGCPCHASTVIVTSKGETHTYTGLPLWRLVAYVDDNTAPAPDEGIHYDDADFNDALAASGYTVTLAAADGYKQSISSQVIAHDDRFIVAFKEDGVFLDPGKNGYMRFVYDDSVVFPTGTTVKSVKFLSSIEAKLP